MRVLLLIDGWDELWLLAGVLCGQQACQRTHLLGRAPDTKNGARPACLGRLDSVLNIHKQTLAGTILMQVLQAPARCRLALLAAVRGGP
jgi:hypothetical protein